MIDKYIWPNELDISDAVLRKFIDFILQAPTITNAQESVQQILLNILAGNSSKYELPEEQHVKLPTEPR